MTDQATSAKSIISRALSRTRLTVAATMVVERGWPLLLPLLVVISVFLSLSWLGVFRMLPDLPRFGLVALVGAIALAALYPLRFFRRPTASEIDRRIERANSLAHTPVLVQADRPSGTNTPFAEALWREHQRRMAATLERLRGDLPRTGVPERDPYGLRAGAALLVVTAFAFSFGPMGGRVTDGFTTSAALEAVPARIDAWVTPPAYTGKAPVFLTAEASAGTQSFAVPASSVVALRVTGGASDETLVFTDASGAVREIPLEGTPADADAPTPANSSAAAVRQFAGKVDVDGTLSLRSGDDELASWVFQVIPDQPPVIRFVGEPKRAANGAFEVSYEIEDDYGAASADAEIALAEPQSPDARALYPAPELKLVLPRRDTKAAKTTKDLTEHVWSGSEIQLTLKTVDAAGQEARTETRTVTLPEKPFSNPLARAVVEHRKILSLDANRKTDVRDLIDAITLRPEDTIKNVSHYLGLMTGRTMLNLAASDDEMRAVADYFWQMALTIEDGGLSDAEKALRQAQEALKQALENGASDEEIDKLMQELRQAMNEFLRQFAEQAQKNPNMAQQMPPNAQELRQSDLQRMLDQIENLAKSGNKDQAQELLSQLQEMMNNLQAGQPQQGQQGQQNSEMRQQMDKLGEIMRRQQEMMTETFRMDQMQRGQNGEQQQGQNGKGQQPGQQGGQGKPMTPQEFAEALKQLQQGQGQLQGDLNALMKGLQGLGIEPGEGFGEAGDEMGNAEGSLGRGEGDRAVGQQGRALEALRKGAQNMMQQMQAMQGEEGGSEQGGRQQNADRDPLGRPKATTGPDLSDSVKVPDEIDVQRARQILDAIRKRLGNALSPALERDYLERLLEMR